MVEETLSGGGSAASVCPWCSATYAGTPDNCPSCGATLEGEVTDPSLPGLTAIDAAAIVRAKQPTSRPRNRLLSWISGEYPEEAGSPGDAAALAPPDLEVRREMLRLELEKEVAALRAEADAIQAEATVEGRAEDATPEDAAAAERIATEVEAIEAELDKVDVELDTDPLGADLPEPDGLVAGPPGVVDTDPARDAPAV
jgi:hypothetical protein